MTEDPKPEPVGWGVFASLFVLLLRLLFTTPYRGLAGFAAVAFFSRDRLAAYGHALRFERNGEPFPDPLPPAEELRRRFLERLPNPDGLVREPDVFAAEGWVVLGARVVGLATLTAAAAVLAGAGFAAWQYGRPWAEARVAANPWSGVPLVMAATAAAWAIAGWLAVGAFALISAWGPVPWFMEWCVNRANRELSGDSPPTEVNRAADPR